MGKFHTVQSHVLSELRESDFCWIACFQTNEHCGKILPGMLTVWAGTKTPLCVPTDGFWGWWGTDSSPQPITWIVAGPSGLW